MIHNWISTRAELPTLGTQVVIWYGEPLIGWRVPSTSPVDDPFGWYWQTPRGSLHAEQVALWFPLPADPPEADNA